jgi:hypothetical protein
MDTELLVKESQNLIRRLDEGKIKPRGAVWVYSSDTDDWRLWIVPSKGITDKFELYRLVSETISAHRDEMPTIDVSAVDFKTDDHPAIKGLRSFIHMDGVGSANIKNNRLNGFFLPDGVIIRMAF